MTAPTVIELFAGAGGAALGLQRAGFQHLALVERDADACATLERNLLVRCPTVTVEGFVRTSFCAEPTLLWSSFPCQPWSQAGSRQGSADSRNGWPITMEAIRQHAPEWFIGENVLGLTRHKRGCIRLGGLDPNPSCPGCYLETVILPELRECFPHVGHFTLDAADYGVPQHRRRVFIWAGPRPLPPPQQTHSHPRRQFISIPTRPWVTCGEALGMTASFSIDGGRNSSANPNQERVVDTSREPAPCIGTRGNQVIRGFWDGRKRKRCLSPEECAILQGFPPEYHFVGSSKRSRYRQVGNAVPPQVAEALGRAILDGRGEA